MMDPTGIKSFLATLYITDFGASVTDPSANPCAVSFASGQDGQLTGDGTRRHKPLFGSDVRDGFVRSPIAVAGGRIDVLGPYNHRYGIGGRDPASSICDDANLCLFRGTVSDGKPTAFGARGTRCANCRSTTMNRRSALLTIRYGNPCGFRSVRSSPYPAAHTAWSKWDSTGS